MTRTTEFDVADYLDSEEQLSEFLTVALAEPAEDVFLAALGAVARRRGMGIVAKQSGLGRESLYKALRPGSHPRYETVRQVLAGMGLRLTVVPTT
jgi:probable addiction module antidote protein